MTKPFNLNNGSIVLIAEIDGGVYSSTHLKKIAALCDSMSVMVKATEDQRLAVIAKAELATAVISELNSIGLNVRNYQSGLHQPVACLGALCPDHEQDALGTAMDISSELAGINSSKPIKIGINGCGQCCTPCHTMDVSVVGENSGYRVSIGGKNAQYPEFAALIADGIPASETPSVIKKIIDTYQTHSLESESLQETVERLGISFFSDVLGPKTAFSDQNSPPFNVDGFERLELDNDHVKFAAKTEDELSAAMDQAATELREIPVKGPAISDIFDVPIHMESSSNNPDIQVNESDKDVDMNEDPGAHLDGPSEEEIEAKLAQSISELKEASDHYQSVENREMDTAILTNARVEFSNNPDSDSDVSDKTLESELIDITNRLSSLENDLRQETADLVTQSSGDLWELDGFDLDAQGKPMIVWKNGIKTIIDCTTQKSGTIHVGKRKISFSVVHTEVQIEIDGIRMVMPVAA